MRVTGVWTAVGAVIAGWMFADLLTHPAGTQAAGGTIVSLFENTGRQISGRS